MLCTSLSLNADKSPTIFKRILFLCSALTSFCNTIKNSCIKVLTSSSGGVWAAAWRRLKTDRVGVVSMSLGIIEECLRLCIDYAKTRTLWGKEIGQFQLIQLKLASMEVARMNVRNMLFRVIESGQAGRQIPLAEASAMKWYCSQAATDVAMDAIQLFGGNGYMTEYRVEQLARDAKSLMIYAGSNEVQITHVAKGLLA